jgi:quercetin dioxygenase-like cupin family protein
MSEQIAPAQPVVTKPSRGEYLFLLRNLQETDAGPGYTTATGHVVEGERMIVGLMRLGPGEVTALHQHPNEQWIYILEGRFLAEVDGKIFEAGPGSVIYQPANVPHGGRAASDTEVVFFTVKDTSHGLYGQRL